MTNEKVFLSSKLRMYDETVFLTSFYCENEMYFDKSKTYFHKIKKKYLLSRGFIYFKKIF